MFSKLTLCVGAIGSVSAAEWSITDAPKVTSYGGVWASTGDIVYAAQTDNDTGPGVEHTDDAFATEDSIGPFGFINTAVAFNKNTDTGLLVYGGGGLATFDNNGNFKHPENMVGFAQDAHAFGDSSFGSAGDYVYPGHQPSEGDLAISHNNGEEWHLYDTGMDTTARYSAFPSDKVWYVTGGTWSSTANNRNSTLGGNFYYSSKLSILHEKDRVVGTHFHRDENVEGNYYQGAIVKTMDGGSTWENVFSTTKFYFNQIDCITEDHCMAVGEGNGKTYAYDTTNGGKTWQLVHTADDGSTLMGVAMLSETEAWLSGGNLVVADEALDGYFWHTTDAGKTWELETLKYALSFGLSFADGVGYSTASTEFNAGIATYK